MAMHLQRLYSLFRCSSYVSYNCFDMNSHYKPIKRNNINDQLFTFNWPAETQSRSQVRAIILKVYVAAPL